MTISEKIYFLADLLKSLDSDDDYDFREDIKKSFSKTFNGIKSFGIATGY